MAKASSSCLVSFRVSELVRYDPAGRTASTIIAQSVVEGAPKATDWLESVPVTILSSAPVPDDPTVEALISVPVVPAMLPAVGEVVDLAPSSPIIMSFAIDVVTPVTVGAPLPA